MSHSFYYTRLRNRFEQLTEILSLTNLHQLVISNYPNTHFNLPNFLHCTISLQCNGNEHSHPTNRPYIVNSKVTRKPLQIKRVDRNKKKQLQYDTKEYHQANTLPAIIHTSWRPRHVESTSSAPNFTSKL